MVTLADDVFDVWRRMVRQPDRFICVDSAVFCDDAVSGPAYAARYGHS